MTGNAMRDIWHRYLIGELPLDQAGQSAFDHLHLGTEQVGISVDLATLPEAQRGRAWALMGYVKWLALIEVGVPMPRPATEAEFAALGAHHVGEDE